MTVRYPSYRQIASMYGVAHSLIARFAKEHNCLVRRRKAREQAQSMADNKLIKMRADAIAITMDDQLRTIDRYLVDFEQAVQEGRVRCDSVGDFNTMVRLRAYILGDADSRKEVIDGLSLEDLQLRHKAMLKGLREAENSRRKGGKYGRQPDTGTGGEAAEEDTPDKDSQAEKGNQGTLLLLPTPDKDQ